MRRSRVVLAAVLAWGTAAAARALDPHRAPSQYVVTKWGARDLPGSTVHALAQTSDRYLWLGTAGGLVRFDGARFVVFSRRGTPGFDDGGVSALAAAPDGALYVGTTSGTVMRHSGGAFTRLPIPAATGFVSALHVARDGALWVGTHGRVLARWKDGAVQAFMTPPKVVSPPAIVEDGRGLWFGTRGEGLVRLEEGTFTRRGLTADNVQALCRDRAGVLWVGTPHGLLRVRGDEVRRITRGDGLSHDNVSALLEDRDGNLWIGTAGGGLDRMSGGRIRPLTTREGLSDDHVRALVEDHEGNLWVGTAAGLSCLSDGRFVTYGRLEGLPDATVAAVAPSGDGSVWVAMSSAGLARLRDGSVERFPLPGGEGDAVISMHESRDGSLWVVEDNGRLFELRAGVLTERTPIGAPGARRVRLVLEDEQGPVFFMGGAGLARLEGRRVVPLSPPVPVRYAHVAYRDAAGTLWLGSSAGLAVVEGGTYRLVRPRDGLPGHRVRSLCGDADGGLWIATNAGLCYRKGGRIQVATTAEGLPENSLHLVLDDGLGFLWIASAGQIFRIAKRELFDLFDGAASRVFPVRFDASDGLRTSEAVLSNSPGFRAADGRLWFATPQGAAVVDPSRVEVDDPAPAVRIERLAVDGRSGLDPYPPGRGEVTIEYTALAFRSWSKLAFRHRLEGLDSDWVDAESRRAAYYANLAPGHYRFSVMASNRDGFWNGPATSVAFTIRPPFYRTTLFLLACAATVLGLAATAHRLRVRAMHARFTAVLDERTRIARELHDTLSQGLAGLGIQIDTALSILPDQPVLGRVRQQLEQGLSMVRTGLSEVRRSIWVLRAQTAKDGNDLASSLSKSLTQLATDAGIQSRFDLTGEPRPLSPDLESNLLRIAHEAVANAVRHAGARSIAIDMHFDRDHLQLRVQDDGRGFNAGALEHAAGDHFGLRGLSERVRSLGGQLRLDSRPGNGTQVQCRLPYRNPVAPADADARGALL